MSTFEPSDYIVVSRHAVARLLLRSFPGYRGGMVYVSPSHFVYLENLIPVGGSHNQYTAIHLRTRKASALRPVLNDPRDNTVIPLPEDVVVLNRSVEGGLERIFIYVRPENVQEIVPQKR